MQKRVGLARAIAADPEIIFFDEPTTGLDPIMAGVINDLIREIVTEMQTNGTIAVQMLPELSEQKKDVIAIGAVASALSRVMKCAQVFSSFDRLLDRSW